MITKYHKVLCLQYLIFACVIGLVTVVSTNQAAIVKELDDWKILPRLQRVTELYFSDEQALPRETKAGAMQKVKFVVRNIEHRTTTYQYDILAVSGDDGSSRMLEKGALSLGYDQTQTIDEIVKVPLGKSRVAIKVELRYDGFADGDDTLSVQKQSIHYWMKVARG
jgi:hypothetical protein